MDDQKTSSANGTTNNGRTLRPLAKRLLAIIYLPFMLLLLPFIALGIGVIFVNASVLGLLQRVSWLRGLRRDGRVIPAATLISTAKAGTLIVDRPSFNFSSALCWWTNDNVTEESPVAIPTDEERIELLRSEGAAVHEFDKWCWQRYLSPKTGSAILVSPARHGNAMARKLRGYLPNLAVVMAWSAPVPKE